MTEAEEEILRASTYITDGVYVHVDALEMVTLLTTDGCAITNRIHLDPQTLELFLLQLRQRGLLSS